MAESASAAPAPPAPRVTVAGLAGAAAVALVSLAYATVVLSAAGDHQPGVDSHYHYRMGGEIARGNLPDMAADLPFTVYTDMNVDHYLGFHVLLAPFVAADDSATGMKTAAAVLFALVTTAIFLFLRRGGVPFAWAWAILPLLFTTLDWRYLMLRGGQLMVPLCLATAAIAVSTARAAARRALFVAVGYVGMLSYQGAVLLPLVHGAALAGLWAFSATPPPRRAALDPLWTVGGLALGLTLNPYMDATAATWRFAAYHLFTMGTDSARLYDRVAEFHAFPPDMLLAHPEWLALLVAAVAGLGWVGVRRIRGARLAPFSAATAGLAVAGLLLGAKALRATEYAVPLVVAFLASLVPSRIAALRHGAVRVAAHAALAAALGGALWAHGGQVVRALGGPQMLNTRLYEGARAALAEHAGAPVLNVAEADYNLLLWDYPDVVTVQGLSRYFLLPNRLVYDDVQTLRDPAAPEAALLAVLHRFAERGVRLVAAHQRTANGRPTPIMLLALRHPRGLSPRFVSPLPPRVRGAVLFALDPAHLPRPSAVAATSP